LAAGTDVNAKNDDGETPLHMFHGLTGHLRFGYLDIIELLIAEGADVNAKDNEGNTPLHMAAYGGVTGSARILIAAGADVNAENNLGMKPLDAAREWVHVGDRGIIVFLQEHGGNATGRSHLRHHWIEELKAKGN
jgi:ankyrin repeat protein